MLIKYKARQTAGFPIVTQTPYGVVVVRLYQTLHERSVRYYKVSCRTIMKIAKKQNSKLVDKLENI